MTVYTIQKKKKTKSKLNIALHYMKSYNLLLSFAALLCFAPVSAQQQSPQLGKSSIDEVLQAMTLEEKITLLIGGEMGGKATTIGATGVTQNLVP